MYDENIKMYLENLINITPELVLSKIQLNNKEFNNRTEFYQFKEYIDNFLEGKSKTRFFIMPGLRGIGKTTLIYQLYDYLLNKRNIPKDRLLLLNLDRIKDFPNFNILDYIDCYLKEIQGAYPLVKEPVFIFVDESQFSQNWDNAGKIIYDEDENVFMIFTGSNALNLEVSKVSARRSLTHPLYPLNFNEYLFLKHGLKSPENTTDLLFDLLWSGEVEDVVILENKLKREIFSNLNQHPQKEWEYYLKFGELPFGFNLSDNAIIEETIDMKNRIIEKDLDLITSLSSANKFCTFKLINMLAIQKPGDISHNTLANTLDKSINSITTIISALEKTHLIFHYEPYGSAQKRTTKSWKYYFLSTQIKSCIYQNIGQATNNPNDFKGLMAENLVASTLFKLSQSKKEFNIFYDDAKNGVDFILTNLFGDIIPIEVGIGNKNTKQLKLAINRKKADYGILISNKTSSVVKEDNIIYMPLMTFSMM